MITKITNLESEVLYKKLRKAGLTPEEASERIKEIKTYLKKLEEKMLKKNKTNDEINKRFREEFEKVYMQLDQ